VQVYAIMSTLKAPGTERMELKYEELLSNVGFKINLRRYIEVGQWVRLIKLSSWHRGC